MKFFLLLGLLVACAEPRADSVVEMQYERASFEERQLLNLSRSGMSYDVLPGDGSFVRAKILDSYSSTDQKQCMIVSTRNLQNFPMSELIEVWEYKVGIVSIFGHFDIVL